MLAYRTSVHEAIKHTPFSLMFGREVQLPIPAGTGQPVNAPLYVKELRKWMSEAYDQVRNHLSSYLSWKILRITSLPHELDIWKIQSNLTIWC